MFATPLRTLPRSLPVRALPQVRYATSSSRYNAYKSQKTKPVVFASLGLVALFGWTAAILTVGAKGGKKDKAARGAKKAHAETTPSPEAAAPSSDDASTSSTTPAEGDNAGAGQSAAFNPETGEINWDCPCLGGMADGPCGEDFKQAFSCFIFSEAEPKGIDCVEKFRGMQECFRKYPEIYGSDAEDLEADEEDEGFDLVSRAEAALALPDEHFMEEVAREAPAHKEA